MVRIMYIIRTLALNGLFKNKINKKRTFTLQNTNFLI